jgi:hypothetical protein
MSVGFLCNCVILEPLKERQAVHTSSSKDYAGKTPFERGGSSARYPSSAPLQHFRERLRGDTEDLSPKPVRRGGLEQLAGAQGGLASEVRLPPS